MGVGRCRYDGERGPGQGAGLVESVLDLTLAWYRPQMWRIENLELVPVNTKWLGHFIGGDCYLLLYTYFINEKPHYLLYIWQVRPHSTLFRAQLLNPTSLYPCQAAIALELNTSGVDILPAFHFGAALAGRSPWLWVAPLTTLPLWLSESPFQLPWLPVPSLHPL